MLDHFGHAQADVLGVSWGGVAAQEFARTAGERCRRLILCATTSGMFMLPGHPKAIARMVTPRRYMSKAYATQVSGDIYGGDFRRRPELAAEFMKHVKWQSMRSLIPNSELKLFDCGHLFLMTRQEESVRAINEFLDKA